MRFLKADIYLCVISKNPSVWMRFPKDCGRKEGSTEDMANNICWRRQRRLGSGCCSDVRLGHQKREIEGKKLFKKKGCIDHFRCYSKVSKIKIENYPLDLAIGSSDSR